MLRRSLVLAALAATIAAAPAYADAFDDVFADYQQDGQITPCKHAQADLESARGQIPSDIEQYAPDFPAALEEAIEERTRNRCAEERGEAPAASDATPAGGAPAGGTTGGAPAATPATPAPPGAAPTPPAAASPTGPAADRAVVATATRGLDRGADDAPAPLVVLAVLGGLLLLVALVWGLLRFFAWEPRWLAGARHATAEAGWRASAAWEDFADWLRGGRPSSPR